jgi:hypothetical protein
MIQRFIKGSTNVLPDPPMAFVIAELPSDPASDDELQPVPQRAVMIATVVDKTNDRRLLNISTSSSPEWHKPAAERIIHRFALANINALLQNWFD